MRGVRRPPRSAGRARTSQADPTLTQIREFYHLPVEEASEQLGVNKSKLKRLCRENGVSRWPQRKLQSLVALRQHIQGDDRLLPQEREVLLAATAKHHSQCCPDWSSNGRRCSRTQIRPWSASLRTCGRTSIRCDIRRGNSSG
ncbi:hypothetical protein Vretimale_9341 [Volvox reticuliferus]|uniref:RWP-RK domain-containing protein n=1 Tax=Volvox reticuliferus TaxID=1737510 RepID=A0A8J4FR53_9CHLO|nr:hypothetical protein Vretifemale_10092 [Volvox reticuliferus]GIM04849.1 hypothetical protein Vretimale_9341 [Volvox reticuliferus]